MNFAALLSISLHWACVLNRHIPPTEQCLQKLSKSTEALKASLREAWDQREILLGRPRTHHYYWWGRGGSHCLIYYGCDAEGFQLLKALTLSTLPLSAPSYTGFKVTHTEGKQEALNNRTRFWQGNLWEVIVERGLALTDFFSKIFSLLALCCSTVL